MADSDLRLIHILNMLPVEPNSITTKEIKEKLEFQDQDFNVSLRTIQRDINKLSTIMPIISIGKAWCFSKDAKLFQLPNMNFQAALGFKLIEQFLDKMLPPAILEFLKPYVNKADEILNSNYDKGLYKDWTKKIAVVNTNPMISAEINEDIINTVYQALFSNKRIKVLEYQKRDLSIESFETDPLGLVLRDSNIYLVCTSINRKYPLIRALHRIKKVEILNEKIKKPHGFKLKTYLKAFQWIVSEEKMKFKAEVNSGIINMFYEKKLSPDQKITPLENGNILLEATIDNTNNMRFFLFSLSDNIRILEPENLLEEFREVSKNLSKFYS